MSGMAEANLPDSGEGTVLWSGRRDLNSIVAIFDPRKVSSPLGALGVCERRLVLQAIHPQIASKIVPRVLAARCSDTQFLSLQARIEEKQTSARTWAAIGPRSSV